MSHRIVIEEWLALNVAMLGKAVARALWRYADGVPCLACRAEGVVTRIEGAPGDAASYQPVHCAACGGRGWVLTTTAPGVVGGKTDGA